MTPWPKVWLIFATFKRTTAALGTIDSLRKYLVYPNLHWHVADDGSGATDDGTDRWHVGVLTERIAEFYPEVTWHEMDTPPGKFNTGGSINKGILAARDSGASIHMLNFDDWALQRELDIRPHVDLLDINEAIGFIRLSYLVSGMAGVCMGHLSSERLNCGGHVWLRLIRDWSTNNPWATDNYLVSTQPYLAHTRFFDAYGWHPEHCNPGEAETGLGAQYLRSSLKENGPQILYHIGPFTTHAPWGHMVGRANYYA